MIRILAMVMGLTGALGLSQFPEFSQQYLQRLSGAVNELQLMATGFDMAAAAAGKSRDEALAEMPDDGFEGGLKATFSSSFRRYDRLSGDLEALQAASPLGRLAQPWRLADRDLVQATWSDFRPAVPATVDGALSAGIGYAGGWALVMVFFGFLGQLFGIRRRRRRNA